MKFYVEQHHTLIWKNHLGCFGDLLPWQIPMLMSGIPEIWMLGCCQEKLTQLMNGSQPSKI
jgi:hypothetical protein